MDSAESTDVDTYDVGGFCLFSSHLCLLKKSFVINCMQKRLCLNANTILRWLFYQAWSESNVARFLVSHFLILSTCLTVWTAIGHFSCITHCFLLCRISMNSHPQNVLQCFSPLTQCTFIQDLKDEQNIDSIAFQVLFV